MKFQPPAVRGNVPLLLAALIGALGGVTWTRACMPALAAEAMVITVTPVDREDYDFAVSCAALGQVSPDLAAWDQPSLDAACTLIARTRQSYQSADYASFVALRAHDVPFADRAKSSETEQIASFVQQLSEHAETPGGYIQAIELFWRALYRESPVQQILPEATKLQLHQDTVTDVGEWDQRFEFDRQDLPTIIEHKLAIPHRNDITAIRKRSAEITWIDVDLSYLTRQGNIRVLSMRYVRDCLSGEWYIHKAMTRYDNKNDHGSAAEQLIL